MNHYERCGGYYGSGGWGAHGSATEEEKRLTMMLFSGIFDSLAERVRLAVRLQNMENISFVFIYYRMTSDDRSI